MKRTAKPRAARAGHRKTRGTTSGHVATEERQGELLAEGGEGRMDKPRHTPGPWTYTEVRNDRSKRGSFQVKAALTVTVATLTYSMEDTTQRMVAEADARLLTHAPDMAGQLEYHALLLRRLAAGKSLEKAVVLATLERVQSVLSAAGKPLPKEEESELIPGLSAEVREERRCEPLEKFLRLLGFSRRVREADELDTRIWEHTQGEEVGISKEEVRWFSAEKDEPEIFTMEAAAEYAEQLWKEEKAKPATAPKPEEEAKVDKKAVEEAKVDKKAVEEAKVDKKAVEEAEKETNAEHPPKKRRPAKSPRAGKGTPPATVAEQVKAMGGPFQYEAEGNLVVNEEGHEVDLSNPVVLQLLSRAPAMAVLLERCELVLRATATQVPGVGAGLLEEIHEALQGAGVRHG